MGKLSNVLDAPGANWQSFYANNIGMFLRNAAIYRSLGGAVEFYKNQGVIPQSSVTPGTRTEGNFSIRFTPAGDVIGNANTFLPSTGDNVNIFGWSDVSPIQDAPYWLLVPDNLNRLVWVAPGAINHNQADLTESNKIDPDLISPKRPFDATDLSFLLGE